MERFVKTKQKTVYLYLGLGFAAVSLIMIVTSVLSAVKGEKMSVQVTGFGAGIMWGAAAFVCFYTYYKANSLEISLLETTDQTEKNNGT